MTIMGRAKIGDRLEEIIDTLADVEHARWSHWQRYLHSKCVRNVDGSLTIPTNLARQWERQLNTKYSDLTEQEKESDRAQVRIYLPYIIEAIAQ